MRKKNFTQARKSLNESSDVDYLKSKIVYLESSLHSVTLEKNALNQEVEKSKYQLLKKCKDLEDKYMKKETELRRYATKYRRVEKDLNRTKIMLKEQKRKYQDLQKQLDKVSLYMFQSYNAFKTRFLHFKGVIRESFLYLG